MEHLFNLFNSIDFVSKLFFKNSWTNLYDGQCIHFQRIRIEYYYGNQNSLKIHWSRSFFLWIFFGHFQFKLRKYCYVYCFNLDFRLFVFSIKGLASAKYDWKETFGLELQNHHSQSVFLNCTKLLFELPNHYSEKLSRKFHR